MREPNPIANAYTRPSRVLGSSYALLRTVIRRIPVIGQAARSTVRGLRKLKARWTRAARLAGHLMRHRSAARRLVAAWHDRGYDGFQEELALQLPEFRHLTAQEWFKRTRLKERQLDRLRAHAWPADAPGISIIMPVYNVREDWLRQAISSVIAQTLPPLGTCLRQ